ncbi:unnamed protein product, partial [Notodromas monacha]
IFFSSSKWFCETEQERPKSGELTASREQARRNEQPSIVRFFAMGSLLVPDFLHVLASKSSSSTGVARIEGSYNLQKGSERDISFEEVDTRRQTQTTSFPSSAKKKKSSIRGAAAGRKEKNGK